MIPLSSFRICIGHFSSFFRQAFLLERHGSCCTCMLSILWYDLNVFLFFFVLFFPSSCFFLSCLMDHLSQGNCCQYKYLILNNLYLSGVKKCMLKSLTPSKSWQVTSECITKSNLNLIRQASLIHIKAVDNYIRIKVYDTEYLM